MASGNTDFVYYGARQMAAAAGLNWTSSPVNMMLVSASYAPNQATDQYVSAIPSGAILLRDIALTSLGVTASGVVHGSIPLLNALLLGSEVTGLVLYYKEATDSISPLIYFTSSGIGFPFFAQGFNYAIGFDQANGGFFTA
jgi:hypothetical protein